MEKYKIIKNIVTDYKHTEFNEVINKIKKEYNQDIANLTPVFLTLDDFEIVHDPTFRAYEIFISWHQYKKIPVILVDDLNDLFNLGETKKEMIERTSFLIKK